MIRGLLDWCYLWTLEDGNSRGSNARFHAMIAQNEDANLEHK
jgi:hypothetical protein